MTPENNSQQGAKWELIATPFAHNTYAIYLGGKRWASLFCEPERAQQIIDALNEREALLECLRKIASDEKEFCYHANLAKSVLTRQPK